ncbi:MAG: IPT/TIG domain-containing protein [Bacteroidota bacterium]
MTTPGGSGSLAGFVYIPVPTISSFSPVAAGAGTPVVISGTGFTGATAVKFGGTSANSFTVINSSAINAIVAGGTSGNVSVTTAGGTATLAGFTFVQVPVITSFTPLATGPGGSVTITGTNLSGATAVSFGGTAASSFTVNSSTSITAIVGSGSSGAVSVTTIGGTATIQGFTFTTLPIVNAIAPASGPIGAVVTITGANFQTTPANNVVYFGSVKANILSASANTITVTVPAGATYKPVSVLSLPTSFIAYGNTPFMVTFPGGQTCI